MDAKAAQERSDIVFLCAYLRQVQPPRPPERAVVVSFGSSGFTVFVPGLGITQRLYLEDIGRQGGFQCTAKLSDDGHVLQLRKEALKPLVTPHKGRAVDSNDDAGPAAATANDDDDVDAVTAALADAQIEDSSTVVATADDAAKVQAAKAWRVVDIKVLKDVWIRSELSTHIQSDVIKMIGNHIVRCFEAVQEYVYSVDASFITCIPPQYTPVLHHHSLFALNSIASVAIRLLLLSQCLWCTKVTLLTLKRSVWGSS
eukprot:15971-Heterococcus_DN1.PRE.2